MTREQIRYFAPVAAAVIVLGIADSMSGSYMVLFASDEAELEPFEVGVFISLASVSGIVISHFAGRRFDRVPSRSILAVVSAIAAFGFAALAFTTSYPVMLLLAATLLGGIAAGFPQLFALNGVLGDQLGSGDRSAALLRSGWSLAWAVGPLAGAAILLVAGYRGLFLSTAATLVGVALLSFAMPRPGRSTPPGADRDLPAPRDSALVLIVAGTLLFYMAMFVGSLALPLLVTSGLGSSDESVGVLFSACAIVEIVAAVVIATLPTGVMQRTLIMVGAAVMIVYFCIAALGTTFVILLVAQVARGVGLALVGIAGIRYFQQLLAPATGSATTLFSNALTAGLLISGVLGGALVQFLGPAATFGVCAALAALSLLTFWIGSRRTQQT